MAKRDSKRKTGLKGAALGTLKTVNPSQIRNAAWFHRRQLAGKVNPRLLNMLRIGRLANVPGSAAGGLGLAIGAGAAIGTAMEKNLPVSKFVSGRGAGRRAFSSQLKINAEREVEQAANQVQRDEEFKETAMQQIADGTIARTAQQFDKPSDETQIENTFGDDALTQKLSSEQQKLVDSLREYDPNARFIKENQSSLTRQQLEDAAGRTAAGETVQDLKIGGSRWVGRGADVRMPDGGSTVLTEHSGDFKWKNLKAGDQLGVMTRKERKAYDKAAKAAQAKVIKAQQQLFKDPTVG